MRNVAAPNIAVCFAPAAANHQVRPLKEMAGEIRRGCSHSRLDPVHRRSLQVPAQASRNRSADDLLCS